MYVSPSVSMSFRGNLISNWPVDPKIRLNVGYGVIFQNSNSKLQIYALYNFFIVFSFEKIPIVVVRDVCLSVRPLHDDACLK